MPLGLGMNDANQESDMADGSIRLHVITKNLQSIRTEARFNDFLVETISCDFDVLFVSETWKDAKEESYTAIGGNRMYFSGGLAHQGVGVIIGNTFHSKLRDISFHAYSPRICVLKCSLGMLKLELFAVYFPTSWDDILEVEGMYTLLQVLLDNYVSRGAYPIIGGDFNACIGPVSRSDDVDLVGCFGFGERVARRARLQKMKNWEPTLDEDGRPAKYHHEIQRRLSTSRAPFSELEQILLNAGTRGGKCSRISLAFRASDELQRLRLQRRLAQDCGELRMLSLQIRTLHRQEFRAWKSSKLEALLRNSGKWKEISRLHATVVRQVPEQPQANEFANMLEQIFGGSPDEVMATAPVFSENDWHKDELLMAIKRLKANKSADEKGLVAELLHFASDDFLDRLLGLFNGLMHSPQVPIDWRKTIFNMLPKHGRAKFLLSIGPLQASAFCTKRLLI